MPDRDEKGRFLKGNAGGPGRPSKHVETALHERFMERLVKQWDEIADSAITEAKARNVHALRLVFEYGIGKPPTVLELRSQDAQLLADVLELMKTKGLSPAAVFAAMLQQLTEDGDV